MEQEIYIKYLNQLTHANKRKDGETPMYCEGLFELFGTSSKEIEEKAAAKAAAEATAEVTAKTNAIIAEKDITITEQADTITELSNTIASLKKILAANGISVI